MRQLLTCHERASDSALRTFLADDQSHIGSTLFPIAHSFAGMNCFLLGRTFRGDLNRILTALPPNGLDNVVQGSAPQTLKSH